MWDGELDELQEGEFQSERLLAREEVGGDVGTRTRCALSNLAKDLDKPQDAKEMQKCFELVDQCNDQDPGKRGAKNGIQGSHFTVT